MQDDVKAAVEEQSVPLLRMALQRRHACAGDHALHEAVRQAHVPAVRLLLQGRANPNARCLFLENGCQFPLQLAVLSASFLNEDERVEVVDLLLGAGATASPKRSDAEANAPLHDAAKRSNIGAMQLLLRHDADPNLVNGYGEAPLELVLRSAAGCIDFVCPQTSRAMVMVLLRAGSCPYAASHDSATGLGPVRVYDPEIREMLRQWSCWWRCRLLAWIRSRGTGSPLCEVAPEILTQVARFL